ncbi:Exosome complex component Rrp4 [Metallosphaera sp. J1]|uniref:exosome complex RNA-binding protein Rrp4 n=1 Tax=Metallosphaera TaxID=41980 RepID=UPI001EE01D38|nr:exosome complex RNA-binding protein Rrp4 [Metallosphaera javensis (ex Hofmann et al. 2022)]MCG3107791.1 Exosome complex component Rrp4 [Metallosphaera javensis (ex Hofmann et al. 2022)]BCS92058.1 MAG: exosome complex component Rrp4 [Metallosphaera javensis (ex Sakai et al. 2022)]
MSTENKIYLQDRTVVVPGDLIAEGNFQIPWSPYIIRQGNKYFASVIGVVEVKDSIFEVIPLEGSHYYPRIGDTVIALVEDVELYGWTTDIKAPYSAYLPASSLLGRPANVGEDLRRYIDVGDYVIAKVESFDRTSDPVLSVKGKGLGRVSSGTVIDILPVKVPRVVGKGKSMLETLSTETGCDILVAQNGRVLANCPSKEKENILIMAIRTIERESHTKGLTDRIKKLIKESLGDKSVTSSEAQTNT